MKKIHHKPSIKPPWGVFISNTFEKRLNGGGGLLESGVSEDMGYQFSIKN